MKNTEETFLFKDKQWSLVEDEVCRVINFTPLASVENNKAIRWDTSLPPYGVVSFLYNNQKLEGYITNEMHYNNPLFYKTKMHKFFALGLPKFYIMLCHKGTFSSWVDTWTKLKKERGQLHFSAITTMTSAIMVWKPEVMED